jgi:hypothetical protein
MVEPDLALADVERLRIGTVEHATRHGDGFHAVLHLAHVLEDAVDHPHDPAGHVVDPDDQPRGQRNGARGDQPWFHSHSAMPVVPAISRPFSVVTVTSIALTIRPACRTLSVWSAIASRA